MQRNSWKKPLKNIFKIAKFAPEIYTQPKHIFYSPILDGIFILISDYILEAKNEELNKTLFIETLNYGSINQFERISIDSFLLTMSQNVVLKVSIQKDSFVVTKIEIPDVIFAFPFINDSLIVVLSNCSTKILEKNNEIKDMWTLNETEKPNSAFLYDENLFIFSTESKLFLGKIQSLEPVIHKHNQINRLYKSTRNSVYVLSSNETKINFISFDTVFNIVRSDTIINSSCRITGINVIFDNENENEVIFYETMKENDWKREMKKATYSIVYCEKNTVYSYSSVNEQPIAIKTMAMDLPILLVPLKSRHFVVVCNTGSCILCRLTDEMDVSQRLQTFQMPNILGENPSIGCFCPKTNSFVVISENGKVVKWEQSQQWFSIPYIYKGIL